LRLAEERLRECKNDFIIQFREKGQDFVDLYMKKQQDAGIDIEIDELTNSIKNVISGDSFSTI